MANEDLERFDFLNDFFNDFLTLFNELSIGSLLNTVALKCSYYVNASYCVCGLTGASGEFLQSAAQGFTPVELFRLGIQPGDSLLIRDPAQTDRPLDSFVDNDKFDLSAKYPVFPAKFPRITSLLYVPIIRNREKIGAILLLNKIGAKVFSRFDQHLIQMLARILAVAINNVNSFLRIANREEELTRRYENLALLNELSKISTSQPENLETLVERIMDTIMATLDIEVGEYFHGDAESQRFTLLYKHGHQDNNSLLGFSEVVLGEGLVGQVAEKRRPYVCSDEEIEILNTKGVTSIHMNYVVIFPLVTQNTVLGVVTLGTRILTEPGPEDVNFLMSIGSYFALLLQEFLFIRERKQTAILQERNRIGMDLHDGVIQSIYGVGLSIEHVRLTFRDDPDIAEARLKQIINTLNATVRDIRSYIMDLKPARLTNENLIQSLRRLANDHYSNTFVPTDFKSKIEDINRISEEHANTFFMICKETLSNVAKHAHAKRVSVQFSETNEDYILTIEDDGVGFEDTLPRKSTSNGLGNMLVRTEKMGGTLLIRSQPGKGTTVTAKIPK